MRKIVAVTLFAVLLLVPSALAAVAEITVPTSIQTVYINQHSTIDIPIKNTRDIKDTFLVSVWPTQWVGLDRYGLTLDPGETKTVTLFFDPPRTTQKGIYEIGVTVKSTNNSELMTKSFLVDLKRDFELYISDARISSQVLNIGDNLISTVVITNLNAESERDVKVTTNILKDDLLLQKLEDEIVIAPSSAETITNSLEIKNTLEYGSYKLKIELKDVTGRVLDDRELKFNIQRNDEFSKGKATEFGLFYLTTQIKVANEGNVPGATYTLTDSVPSYFKYFFFPDIEPTSQQEIDGRIVYTWQLALNPGETKTVLYQVRFTTVVVAVLAVGIALYLFNYYYFRPHIRKRHPLVISQPKEEVVHIHVKNRSRKEIQDIVVKDHVPPLAKIVKRFDTVKPEIKLTTKGTYLTWKLDKLGRGEERVLTYRMIPVMETPGGIKLPKAHFTYKGKKHLIDRIAEKVVERFG